MRQNALRPIARRILPLLLLRGLRQEGICVERGQSCPRKHERRFLESARMMAALQKHLPEFGVANFIAFTGFIKLIYVSY